MSRFSLRRTALSATLAVAACGGDTFDPASFGVDPCTDIAAGELVISEILTNPDGSDDGKEYFEVYNASDRTLPLTGLVLHYSREDGTGIDEHAVRSGEVAAGEYWVFGGVLPEFAPSFVDYGYAAAISMRNGGAILALRCGDTEVDRVLYPEDEGAGVALILDGSQPPDAVTNDDPLYFCAATTEFAPEQFGSPGAANERCEIIVPGQCKDDGVFRAISGPSPGDIVITEFMANPDQVGDSVGEWFEVHALAPFDLNELVFGRSITDGERTETVLAGDCIEMTAGDYAIIAQSADPAVNGGLPAVVETLGSVSLLNSDGDLFIDHSSVRLDTITWTTSATGASTALDPGQLDPTANDDPGNWVTCNAIYGDGDRGTPAAANDACLLPPPCLDGGVPRQPVPPTGIDDIEIVEIMPDPTRVNDSAGEWFEILVKNPVDLNGLELGEATPAGGAGTVEQTLTSVNCLRYQAGDRLIVAQNGDSAQNGGIATVDVVMDPGFSLLNSNGGAFISIGGTVLSMLTYTGTHPAGVATQIDGNGTECPASTEYGLACDNSAVGDDCDVGSPRLQNPDC